MTNGVDEIGEPLCSGTVPNNCAYQPETAFVCLIIRKNMSLILPLNTQKGVRGAAAACVSPHNLGINFMFPSRRVRVGACVLQQRSQPLPADSVSFPKLKACIALHAARTHERS